MPAASLIVPMYNAAAGLPTVLPPIADLPNTWEIILVDDGSHDDTVRLAQSLLPRAQVIRRATRGGAWRARNDGVSASTGPVLVFLDSDVRASVSALQALVTYLQEHPGVSAAFGSYDAAPAAPGRLSRFRNLLHHYVHQAARGPVPTFWAGCGAAQRAAVQDVGSFAGWPGVEDVELGLRLDRAGHVIHLLPDIQVTHLKAWTWGSFLSTDLWLRARPWAVLMRRYPRLRSALNTAPRYRLAPLLLLLLPLHPALGVLYLLVNLPVYRFMYRCGGAVFSACCIGYMAAYHVVCLCGLLLGSLTPGHYPVP